MNHNNPQTDWEKYVQERREQLERELNREKAQLEEKAKEDAYYQKSCDLIDAIQDGNLSSVKKLLKEAKWDGKSDYYIDYRTDVGGIEALSPVWKKGHTTLLNEAIEADQIDIVSYVVKQPQFHENDRELLSKIGSMALKHDDDELLNKTRNLLKNNTKINVAALKGRQKMGR